MRKIKSAPSYLSTMSNNKKQPNIIKISHSINITTYIFSNRSNYQKIKDFKISVQNTGAVINDLISDNKILSLEESTIINAFISYLSENINKEKKINELYKYLIQYIVRYIVLIFIHSLILHDDSDKYITSIDHFHNIISDNSIL